MKLWRKQLLMVTGNSLILAQFCQCQGIIRLVVKLVRSWGKMRVGFILQVKLGLIPQALWWNDQKKKFKKSCKFTYLQTARPGAFKIKHEVLGNLFHWRGGRGSGGTTILGSVQKTHGSGTWGHGFSGGLGSTGLDWIIYRCFPTVMNLHSPVCGKNLRLNSRKTTKNICCVSEWTTLNLCFLPEMFWTVLVPHDTQSSTNTAAPPLVHP